MEKLTTTLAVWLCILFICLQSCTRDYRVSAPDIELTEEIAALYPEEIIPAEESILEIPEPIQEPVRMTLEEIYLSQLGVREATGRNDGPEVEMYLASVGKPKGLPWCSAFVAWCLTEADIPHRVNAWSPTAHNGRNIVYMNREARQNPQAGDVFTLFYPRLNRIGHAGFYHKNQNSSVIVTVEGNTNEAGSREGDGVYKRYRPLNSIHSITRWK
jgi:hypothetical protein